MRSVPRLRSTPCLNAFSNTGCISIAGTSTVSNSTGMSHSSKRHFDAEIYLSHPQSEATALAAAAAFNGVRHVEVYSAESVSSVRADGLNIVSTYPDGGHGSLRLQSIPLDSAFVMPHLREGR